MLDHTNPIRLPRTHHTYQSQPPITNLISIVCWDLIRRLGQECLRPDDIMLASCHICPIFS